MVFFFVTPIVFESLLCALALAKAVERFRAPGVSLDIWRPKGLIDVLLRDSAGYYLAIIVAYGVNLYFWAHDLVSNHPLPIRRS